MKKFRTGQMNDTNIPVICEMAEMVVNELFHYRNASCIDAIFFGEPSSFLSIFNVGSEPLDTSEIEELHMALRNGVVVDDGWGVGQVPVTTLEPHLLFIWWPQNAVSFIPYSSENSI